MLCSAFFTTLPDLSPALNTPLFCFLLHVGGQGQSVQLKDVAGPAFLTPLLKLLPRLAWHQKAMAKRLAASLLLELVTKSSSNAEMLEEPAPEYGSSKAEAANAMRTLMVASLRECLLHSGDIAMQIDLVEALYRLARHGAEGMHAAVLAGPQGGSDEAAKQFEELVGKATARLDLARELRRILVTFNSALTEPSVHSFRMSGISLSLPYVSSASTWVDVGLRRCMSLAVRVAEPDADPEDGEPPVETIDIPFCDISSATLCDDPHGSVDHAVVDVVVMETPTMLTQDVHGRDASRPFTVTLRGRAASMRGLLDALPEADRSAVLRKASQQHDDLWDAVVPAPAAAAAPPGTAAPGKRRRPKMSVGLTAYGPLPLQHTMPRASKRELLLLSTTPAGGAAPTAAAAVPAADGNGSGGHTGLAHAAAEKAGGVAPGQGVLSDVEANAEGGALGDIVDEPLNEATLLQNEMNGMHWPEQTEQEHQQQQGVFLSSNAGFQPAAPHRKMSSGMLPASYRPPSTGDGAFEKSDNSAMKVCCTFWHDI